LTCGQTISVPNQHPVKTQILTHVLKHIFKHSLEWVTLSACKIRNI